MVASDLDKILNSTKLEERLAIKVIRDMKSLHGAGVYTSLELFAMAGEHLYLHYDYFFLILSLLIQGYHHFLVLLRFSEIRHELRGFWTLTGVIASAPTLMSSGMFLNKYICIIR